MNCVLYIKTGLNILKHTFFNIAWGWGWTAAEPDAGAAAWPVGGAGAVGGERAVGGAIIRLYVGMRQMVQYVD